MSEDWKNERAEASMREGTEKIMKDAQQIAKEKAEMISNSPVQESFDENVNEEIKPKYIDVCLGVGMNQLFPETTRIILEDSEDENS